MDPEIKRQLEEIHALAKDNHHLLRSVRRHQLFGIVTSIVFWLVILITPFYIYSQYLQPLVTKFQVPGSATSANPAFTEIQNLLNSFKAK